jgi:hypothetical protein
MAEAMTSTSKPAAAVATATPSAGGAENGAVQNGVSGYSQAQINEMYKTTMDGLALLAQVEQGDRPGAPMGPTWRVEGANVLSVPVGKDGKDGVVTIKGGDADQRDKVADEVKTLMGKPNGMKVITTAIAAIGNDELNVRIINCKTRAWWNPDTKEVNIDPGYTGEYMTAKGMLRVPNFITLGHEIGHGTGTIDNGPRDMNNVIKWENPIRRDFRIPERTVY